MPITKQAIKKIRQDKKKSRVNAQVKKAFKVAVTSFRKNPREEALVSVYKLADRAAKTNVIHKNKAARLKSRLSKLLGSPTQATPKTQTL